VNDPREILLLIASSFRERRRPARRVRERGILAHPRREARRENGYQRRITI